MLTPKAAAERLGITVRMLKRWRREGRGPTAIKFGHRTVRYPASSLAQWISGQQAVENPPA